MFFAAHAADKTARSVLQHKPMPATVFVDAAKERLLKPVPDDEVAGGASSATDTLGLFAKK